MTLRQAVLTGLTIILLSFELLVMVILVSFPYFQDPGLAKLNSDIYTSLTAPSTVLLIGLLYFWLIKVVAIEMRRHSPKFNSFIQFISEPFDNLLSGIKNTSLSESVRSFKVLSRPRLLLASSLAVSVLLAFLPYRPDLNPTGRLVGVDSPTYVNWISQMLARPFTQALQYSFVEGLNGSRPLLLILLYLVASAGIPISTIIECLPMVLASLLTLSTFIFVCYGHGSTRLAGLTSLFTPISFYTTVGLWGGYYANWLALTFAYLFLTSLLVFSKKQTILNYAVMFIVSLGLFFIHPWTWVLVLTVSLLFTVSLQTEDRKLVRIESIIGIIALGVVLDLVKSWAFTTRSVATDIATKLPNVVGLLPGFWNNLVQALLYTHGGLTANWLVLLMALMAAFTLRFKDPFERLLLQWLLMSSIAFLVLDSYGQARIVYDLPVPVLISITAVLFVPQIGTRNVRWPWLVVALVILTLASYAFQGILLV